MSHLFVSFKPHYNCNCVLVWPAAFQPVCKALKTANDAQDKSVVDQEALIVQAESAADAMEAASATVVSSAAFVVAAAIATAVF